MSYALCSLLSALCAIVYTLCIVARKALMRCGRITMYEHAANDAAVYSINPFYDELGNTIIYEEEANRYTKIIRDDDAPEAEVVKDVSGKFQPQIPDENGSPEISSVSKTGQKNEEISQMVVPPPVQNEPILEPLTAPINKQNKTKENKTKQF